ncbi:hypothetical protein NDU88_001930 [Pleurodeles waltl]|uniref:Uncharacterized protein n=1 Tax=Pleurodeles waltl TaxID=8319 RepID=A0AAV7L202_PLEWA|nr:hypothetical protein NDU88_001930 [Pleurodeles waltl]
MVAGVETPPSLDTMSWCRRLLPMPPGVPPSPGESLVVLVLLLHPGVPLVVLVLPLHPRVLPPPRVPLVVWIRLLPLGAPQPPGVLLVVWVLPLPLGVLLVVMVLPLCPSSRPRRFFLSPPFSGYSEKGFTKSLVTRKWMRIGS